jgi:hypothetical protein
VTAVLALAGLLLAVRLLPEGEDRAVAWTDLTPQIGPMTIVRADRRVFRERSRLQEHLRGAHPGRPLPAVDFSTRQLLLVSAGARSSTGYAVEVLSVREQDGKITVRIRERSPRVGDDVEPRVTYPYRLLSLPAGPDVYVDWLGR